MERNSVYVVEAYYADGRHAILSVHETYESALKNKLHHEEISHIHDDLKLNTIHIINLPVQE